MTQPKPSSTFLVFLFTDLVGSTKWKDTLRDAAYHEFILQPHNDLCRKLLREFSEAAEKNFTGDGFLITFATPSSAAQFALRLHEALHHYPWHESVTRTGSKPETRIGIHSGEAIAYVDASPDKTQVTGQAVDLAARIMGLADGRQTLLTRHAFDSARQYVTDERLNWLNHGRYRCKGSDDPLEVCEVGVPGHAPLAAPADSEKAKRVQVDVEDDTGSWRPAAGLAVPRRDGWIIERKLGEGGFGEVWLGQHRRTKKKRVFKFCFDGERLRSFKRELTFFKLIEKELGNHPNIARLHEVQLEAPPYFLEGEFVESGNLADWVESQGGLDKVLIATRLRLMAEISRAVAAAHSLGIIHKDLKPSNILIALDRNGEPQPQLSDFGIGILSDRTLLERGAITETGFTESVMFGNDSSRTGTRLYSPPEANLGKPATTAFDIYALGVMLFQMIRGDLRRPLGTGWQEAVAFFGQSSEGDPLRAELLLEDITAATYGEPAKRLPSALNLAERLENLERRRDERLAQRAREEQARLSLERDKRLKRLGWFSAASLVVLAVVAFLGVFAWQAKNRADDKTREAQAEAKRADDKTREAQAEAKRADDKTREAQAEAKRADDKTGEAQAEARRADDVSEKLKSANEALTETNENLKREKEETERVLAELANARLTDADHLYEKGNVISAYDQLSLVPHKLRGWEWAYRRRYFDNADMALYGHTGSVYSVSWSPNGRRLASASDDRTLRIWDAASGQGLLELKGHTAEVTSVSWSPDGRRLASASCDKTLRIWDAANGQGLLELKGHTAEVTSVSWSPDGRRLASASDDRTLRIWDAASGQGLLELKGHAHGVNSVSWSPDSRRLASASDDRTLRIWDAASGQGLLELKGHTDRLTSVSWGPDGQRLASTSYDKTLRIWDAASGRGLLELKGHTDRLMSVSWGPDGRRLASSSCDKTLRIWDAASGQELLELKGHTSWVNSGSWSPDGRRLASASWDKTLRIWDAASGQGLLELKGHSDYVTSVSWSPDGRRLVSASGDKTLRIWDAASGQGLLELKGHTNRVMRASWSPNGRRLASASYETLRIWDAASGQGLLELKGHTAEVTSVSWSPDGRRLASASFDKTLRIWDAASGQGLLELKGHSDYVTSVSWSPDGRRLASASGDKTLRIWDAASGQGLQELKGHSDYVTSVSWSPNGRRLASASRDMTLRIWDVSSGQVLLELKGHTAEVTSVSWSPDGRRLASASYETLRIWDAATGQELVKLKGHTAVVTSVSWSPDERRLASASGDKTLRIWDVSSGRGQLELKGHTAEVTSVSWSPDGRRLASASGDRTLRIWDAASGQGQLELKGHTAEVTSVSWSPEGRRLASASGDRTLRIWDAASGQEVLELKGHTSWVNSVSWSPDGRRLASAGYDKRLRIWDAQSGKELERPDVAPEWALRGDRIISPDGQLIAHVDQSVVRLIPAQFDPDELAFRQAKARFDPFWAEKQADLAQLANDSYALTFFRSTLAESDAANRDKWTLAIAAAAKSGNFESAWQACNRLLMRDPGLAPVYRQRAIVRQQAFDGDGAWADILTAAVSRPSNLNGWPEFAKADSDHQEYDWAWHWQPHNLWHGHNQAWQQLARGNENGFRTTCRQLLDRFAVIERLKTPVAISAVLADGLTLCPSPSRGFGQLAAQEVHWRQLFSAADAIVYTSAIAPDCGIEAAELLRLAETTFGPNVTNADYQETLGAIHFRAGNSNKAIEFLESAAKQKETNWQRLFLAMAWRQSGNAAKANEWLAKAEKNKPAEDAPWTGKLIWDRLSKEAAEMLKKPK